MWMQSASSLWKRGAKLGQRKEHPRSVATLAFKAVLLLPLKASGVGKSKVRLSAAWTLGKEGHLLRLSLTIPGAVPTSLTTLQPQDLRG